MTSKERVLMAINHEEPDKVPLDSWLAPEVADVLIRLLGVDTSKDPFALAKRLGNDFLYRAVGFCEGFSTIYDENNKIGDNLYQDAFGIKWSFRRQDFGGYCEMVEHPLADLGRISTRTTASCGPTPWRSRGSVCRRTGSSLPGTARSTGSSGPSLVPCWRGPGTCGGWRTS